MRDQSILPSTARKLGCGNGGGGEGNSVVASRVKGGGSRKLSANQLPIREASFE